MLPLMDSFFHSPFSNWPLESKFVNESRDRDRMDIDPKWLSLAAASKQELEIVTDILTGVIRCVSLHPHLWNSREVCAPQPAPC